MKERLMKSLQEAVAYAKGDTRKGHKTSVKVVRTVKIPRKMDLKTLRAHLHMTQVEFAARYGFNLNTLRNWEHGRRHPDQAVLAYLYAISKNPKMIEKTLSS